jgi:hypothetical protein
MGHIAEITALAALNKWTMITTDTDRRIWTRGGKILLVAFTVRGYVARAMLRPVGTRKPIAVVTPTEPGKLDTIASWIGAPWQTTPPP